MAELDEVLGARARTKYGSMRTATWSISPLSAEDVPAEAAELKDVEKLAGLLPFAPIASVLIKLDGAPGSWTASARARRGETRSPELKRNLIAVLIAQATNLGLARTADACGIAYDTLAWTQEWYVREETLRAAGAPVQHSPEAMG